MVDLKENGKSVSVEPTLLRISDKLILRYVKLGNGPPLVLLHTIRTQLEYFRGPCHASSGLRSRWRLASQGDGENQL